MCCSNSEVLQTLQTTNAACVCEHLNLCVQYVSWGSRQLLQAPSVSCCIYRVMTTEQQQLHHTGTNTESEREDAGISSISLLLKMAGVAS